MSARRTPTHPHGTRPLRLLLVPALIAAFFAGLCVPSAAAAADDTPPRPEQARPPHTQPKRNRALERKLYFAIITAATHRDPARRAAAEATIAAADRVSRFYAYVDQLDYGRRAVRLYAARGLLALGERAAIAHLVRALVRENDRRARLELTRILRDFDVPGTGGLFANHLGERDPKRRFRALQAMGVFPDRRVVPVLIRRLRFVLSNFPRASASFTRQHAYIKGWRAVSGGSGNQVVTVADPEIDVFETGVAIEVKVARIEVNLIVELLEDFTGQRFGADAARWAAWLSAHPEFARAPR